MQTKKYNTTYAALAAIRHDAIITDAALICAASIENGGQFCVPTSIVAKPEDFFDFAVKVIEIQGLCA